MSWKLYNMRMNRSGKIITVIALLVIGVTVYKYKQFFLDKDFLITALVVCNPSTEVCFQLSEPDTSSSILFSDGAPYKYITLPASQAPQCILDSMCTDFACTDGDTACKTTYCAEDTLSEGEECVPQAETSSMLNATATSTLDEEQGSTL